MKSFKVVLQKESFAVAPKLRMSLIVTKHKFFPMIKGHDCLIQATGIFLFAAINILYSFLAEEHNFSIGSLSFLTARQKFVYFNVLTSASG